MSQQGRLPQLNFSVEDYFNAPQPSSANALPTQWRQNGSFGAPGHLGLRPSSSIDSLQSRRRTASSSRSEKSYNYNQPSGLAHRNENLNPIDPSLGDNGLLSVTRSHGSRMSMADLHRAPNPIARFYNEDASPWNPEKILRGPAQGPKDGRSLSSNLGPNLEFNSYRDHPGSELESTGTGVAGDSGYGTLSQPATQSIASMEPAEYNQDVPADINFHLTTFNFATGSTRPTNSSRAEKTDRTKPSKVRSLNQKSSLKCPECGEVAKCPSEMKKHQLKHAKPFKCTIRNCRRGTRGFTTVNDLNRHKKSVHNINIVGSTTKSYQCASEHCRNREKIWPRLDNFKQHIHRMHKEEDVEQLIIRSLYRGRQSEDSPTPQPLSVAPMDTTLAGIGLESNFSIPSYHAPGGPNLTPDQTSQNWGNLDVSPRDFEIDDSNPPTNHFYTSSSQHPDQGISSGYRQPDIGQSTHMDSNTPVSWRSDSSSTNLGVLADVACNAPPQASSSNSSAGISQRTPALSREPQTKAEQQRRTLGQISRMIASKIPENTQGPSLDKAVFRILSRATGLEKSDSPRSTNDTSSSLSDNDRSSSDDSTEGGIETMTTAELAKGLRALANHVKRDKGNKSMIVGHRQRSYSGCTETCPTCHKILPRRCDLKKHMKRHTRPYGCTFPKCKRSFGSKSDWKRHENSQHFQLETWRCQQPKEQSCCAELFFRREVFEEHLKEKHDVTGEEIANEVKACRIGRNGQGQFWCGFCTRIIPLQNKRSAAWDERFNHIDEHFRDGKNISNWLCLEARKTKGEVLKEMDKSYFDDDDDVGGDDMQDDDSSPSNQSMASEHQTPSNGSNLSPIFVEESPANSSNPRKRPSSTEPISSGKTPAKRKEIVRFCCECKLGPYPSKLYASCMNCQHEFCSGCSRKAVASINDIELDIFAHGN